VGEYPSFSGFSELYTVIHLNLAYRWFCRLGLDGDVPDHSTFSKNCHGRFRESDLLRKLFETVVARCMKEGIVGGDRLCSLMGQGAGLFRSSTPWDACVLCALVRRLMG